MPSVLPDSRSRVRGLPALVSPSEERDSIFNAVSPDLPSVRPVAVVRSDPCSGRPPCALRTFCVQVLLTANGRRTSPTRICRVNSLRRIAKELCRPVEGADVSRTDTGHVCFVICGAAQSLAGLWGGLRSVPPASAWPGRIPHVVLSSQAAVELSNRRVGRACHGHLVSPINISGRHPGPLVECLVQLVVGVHFVLSG